MNILLLISFVNQNVMSVLRRWILKYQRDYSRFSPLPLYRHQTVIV